MASFLNPHRPPAFCPGCSHERSLHALDLALAQKGLAPENVVIVSDIGCSGLFDTFFNTHAMHGLHGRALTYAAGIKLARPHLEVVVAMGDGGLGIGGAHFLAACRRNLKMTLLILNNFSFAMTGGQFSCTTPEDATVASGFLNTIEKPMDICTVAAAAGAPFVARSAAHRKDLVQLLAEALSFNGFSVIDIQGLCPGRYLKRNPLTHQNIDAAIDALPPFHGPLTANIRPEYGEKYREASYNGTFAPKSPEVEAFFSPPVTERREVTILGTAGERVISAGALLARAALSAGMQVTQKNDYNITVMRGPSVTELILSPEPILYTEVEEPDVILALSRDGVTRRRDLFGGMKPESRVIADAGLDIPGTSARVTKVDFKSYGIRKPERALAALVLLASSGDPITPDMLGCAIRSTFRGKNIDAALGLMDRTAVIIENLNLKPKT